VREASVAAEIKALGKVVLRKDILILLPVFWAAYFNQYYGNFEVYYFGVRARALIGFVVNFAGLLSSQLISTLLDYKNYPVKKRLNIGFYYVVFWHVVAWVYAWVINEKFGRDQVDLDWVDHEFTEGFFVLILWTFSQQCLQNWLYYFVSTKTDNISELTRFTGILRGQESFAQAVSFGINARDWHFGHFPMGVNTALLILAIYPTWIALRDHVPVELEKDYSYEHSDKEVENTEIVTTKVAESEDALKLSVGQK